MSFAIEFVDRDGEEGAAWTLCARDESLDLILRWRRSVPDRSDLEPRRRSLKQCRARLSYSPRGSDSLMRPTVVELHAHHEPGAEEEEWLGRIEVAAPRWVALALTAEVEGLDEAGISLRRRAKALLIPRHCALAASGVSVAAILGLVAVGAVTFATLQLTLSSAIPGISGATLLGLAAMLVRRVGRRAYPHWPPMLGIPYMLRRAVPAVVCMGLILHLATQRVMAAVVNVTEAEVEFRLPGRASVDTLAPGTELSYLRSVEELEKAVVEDLDDPYCVFSGEEKRDCPEIGGNPSQRRGSEYPWMKYFEPPKLQIRCALVSWNLKSKDKDEGGGRYKFACDSADGETFEFQRGDACELEPRECVIRDKSGAVEYEARFPWRPSDVENSELARVSVTGGRKGVLEFTVEAPQTWESGLRRSTLRRGADEAFMPVDAQALAFTARVKHVGEADNKADKAQESRLECRRALASDEFALWWLDLHRRSEVIVQVKLESHRHGWESSWVTEGNNLPVCSAGSEDFDELTIWIDETQRDAVRLDLGRRWIGDSIEVRSKADRRLLGRLECRLRDEETLRLISPERTKSKLKGLKSLEFEDKQSVWTPEIPGQGTRPWACVLGDKVRAGKAVFTNSSVKRSAEFEDGQETLRVGKHTCYVDLVTGEVASDACQEGKRECELKSVDIERSRKALGKQCTQFKGCTPSTTSDTDGGTCP